MAEDSDLCPLGDTLCRFPIGEVASEADRMTELVVRIVQHVGALADHLRHGSTDCVIRLLERTLAADPRHGHEKGDNKSAASAIFRGGI